MLLLERVAPLERLCEADNRIAQVGVRQPAAQAVIRLAQTELAERSLIVHAVTIRPSFSGWQHRDDVVELVRRTRADVDLGRK